MEIFIAIFLVIFLGLAAKRLDWSLLLIIALLPSYLIRFQIFSIPLTLLEAMIILAFLLWLYREAPSLKQRLLKKEKKTPYPFSREIILLLLVSFLSVIVAKFSLASLGTWKAYFFEPILLFILIINVFTGHKNKNKIFLALGFSVLLVSFLAIYQKITGNLITNSFWAASESRRVTSFFGYPNAVGLFLAPIISLFLGFILYLDKDRWRQKIFFSILVVLGVLSIIFACSEGALIAFTTAAFILFFLSGKSMRLISSSIAVMMILIIFTVPTLRESFYDKATFSGLSGQIRLQQWEETVKTLKGKAFILGNGLSSYQQAVAPYHQDGLFFNYDKMENFDALVWASPELREKYWQPVEIYLYPHNIFLNFWSEIGLLGLLLFMFLMFKAVIIAINLFRYYAKTGNSKRYLLLGIISALVAMFIHGLVDVPYFKNDLAAFFWVLLAFLSVIKIEKENEKSTI